MGLGVGVGISIGRDGGVAGNVPDAPTVTAPAASADIYDGIAVTLTATVTAGQVPHKIEFLLDDTTVIASDSASPYSQSWTPSGVSAGAHTIKARFVYSYGTVTSAATNVVLFDPTVISGLLLWLRSDKEVTYDGSNLVSQWDDQSGNDRHFTGSGANRPLYVASAYNSKPCVRAQDATDFLTAAAEVDYGTAATIVHVFSTNTTANAYAWTDAALGAGGISRFDVSKLEWANGADRYTYSASPAAGLHVVTTTQTDGAALIGYFDGTQSFSQVPAVALTGLKNILGRGTGANGTNSDWCETVVYNSILSAGNRARLHAYVAAVWGITVA